MLLFPDNVTTAAGRAGHQDDEASDGRTRLLWAVVPAECGCGIEGGSGEGRGKREEEDDG